MNILEDLWYGNIIPVETDIEKNSQYHILLKEVIKAENKLIKALSDEQQQLFESYKAYQNKLYCEAECQAFVKGFKLGCKIITEIK
jgi:inorganic pyrophosphatase